MKTVPNSDLQAGCKRKPNVGNATTDRKGERRGKSGEEREWGEVHFHAVGASTD